MNQSEGPTLAAPKRLLANPHADEDDDEHDGSPHRTEHMEQRPEEEEPADPAPANPMT